MADIGKSIKVAIALKGKNQTEIAKGLDVTRQTVSNWINGSQFMRANKMLELCRLLDMKASDFVKLGE